MLLTIRERATYTISVFATLIFAACTWAWYLIHYHTSMERLLEYSAIIESGIALIIAITSIFAIIFAHAVRFFRALILRVPYRVTFASMYDSIEHMAELVAIVGLGVAMPVWLSEREFTYALPLIFISVSVTYLVFFVTLLRISCLKRQRRHAYAVSSKRYLSFMQRRNVRYNVAAITIVIAALAMSAGVTWSVRAISVADDFNRTAAIVMLIHAVLIFAAFVCWFSIRITGNYRSESTCIIDGNMYVLAMRHTNSEWVLLRCRLGGYNVDSGDRYAIYFTPGKYIVRSLKDVGEITARDWYVLKPEAHETISALLE